MGFWKRSADRKSKKKLPYELSHGTPNKYGAKVATKGHRVTSNGSIIVSVEYTPKTSTRR